MLTNFDDGNHDLNNQVYDHDKDVEDKKNKIKEKNNLKRL